MEPTIIVIVLGSIIAGWLEGRRFEHRQIMDSLRGTTAGSESERA